MLLPFGSHTKNVRTATYVVAAYNALDTSRADFVCPGTNDDVAVQAYLNSLPAAGGTVQLTDGVYNFGSTVKMTQYQRLIGQGVGATTIQTSSNITLIQMGNRQSDSTMRNFMLLEGMSVTQNYSGSQTASNVKIDGGGQGTSIKNVQANQGYYGFELMDLDRCYFENISGSNSVKAGIFLEVGLENTWGTTTFVNCTGVLSNNNSYGMYMNANADQSSPNAPDRLNFIGCHFFMTTGLTGCIGFYNVLQMTSVNFIGCLFEQNIRQFRSDGNGSVVNFQGCTFLDTNNACTDIAYLTDSYGSYTFRDCRFQQATNGFNSPSGYPHLVFEGKNTNQGSITNLFAGSFANKMGTDTAFAGAEALELGTNSQPFSTTFSQLFQGQAIILNEVAKSSAYNIGLDDYAILVTGNTTVTLPTAVGCAGQMYVIKKIDSSATTTTIATTSGQTIDGSTTATITVQYLSLTVISDGSNWNII